MNAESGRIRSRALGREVAFTTYTDGSASIEGVHYTAHSLAIMKALPAPEKAARHAMLKNLGSAGLKGRNDCLVSTLRWPLSIWVAALCSSAIPHDVMLIALIVGLLGAWRLGGGGPRFTPPAHILYMNSRSCKVPLTVTEGGTTMPLSAIPPPPEGGGHPQRA